MRYYYYTLGVINGEFEYTHKNVVRLDDDESIENWLEEQASTFYTEDSIAEDMDMYSFFEGIIRVYVDTYRELTSEEYKTLYKYL